MGKTRDLLREALRPPLSLKPPGSEAKDWSVYAVPVASRYSDKIIPQHLIDKLSRLSPDVFTRYVQERMTRKERDTLMKYEFYRLKTFFHGWPHTSEQSELRGSKMAQSGFYFVGEADKVMCPFCQVTVSQWNVEDNPLHEHLNTCPYSKGIDCDNRPHYRKTPAARRNRQEDPLFSETSGPGKATLYAPHLAVELKSTPELLGVVMKDRADERQATVTARMRTFGNWSHTSVPARTLAEAGFYSLKTGDQVKCFLCEGVLQSWNCDDCPWTEHARWFPYCEFLIETKGDAFIKEVLERFPLHAKSSFASNEQHVAPQTLSDQMVNICLKLGHTQQTIDLALAHNGGSFKDVETMIDVLHQIEDGEIQVAGSSQEKPDEKRICPPGDCRKCFLQDQSVRASHIGLPCGHLIFCDACADNSKQSADNGNSVACLYPQCNSTLLGNLKICLN